MVNYSIKFEHSEDFVEEFEMFTDPGIIQFNLFYHKNICDFRCL